MMNLKNLKYSAYTRLVKKNIIFNKPIYVGFCVLESSKFLMSEWFYDRLPFFGLHNVELQSMHTE